MRPADTELASGETEKAQEPHVFPSEFGDQGMSLRDYFAARAMQGLLSERQLIDLGLGLIDVVAGGDGQNPKINEVSVTYSNLHLAALRAVAKALRDQGIQPSAPNQNMTTHT